MWELDEGKTLAYFSLLNEYSSGEKANRTVHPDRVEAFLRQGLAMMNATAPLQDTRDDEAQLCPQPIDSVEARRYLRCKRPDNRLYNVVSSNWDRNVSESPYIFFLISFSCSLPHYE